MFSSVSTGYVKCGPVPSPCLPSVIEPPQLTIIGRNEPSRVEIERYIVEKFAASYGAKVAEFMPYFLVLQAPRGFAGVLGIRRGQRAQPFFMENYLAVPAEQALSQCVGRTIPRQALVEVGNLVSAWRGSSQLLFIALAALIVQVGAEWAVFTATPEVQKLLGRLGVKQYVLGTADGSKLGEQLADWGTYYKSSPSLVAVNAVHALNIFARQPMSSMLLASCKHQLEISCSSNNIGTLYD